MSNIVKNHSKGLSKVDDSAASLLIQLLDGDVGRNFDIESLFVHKNKHGSWEFIVLEFLKCESKLKNVDVYTSHPNRYWNKNKRKFLSLWTVVKVIRQAGLQAKLLLVNYDERKEKIKLMNVVSIDQSRERNWVDTKDECISFNEFKERFRKFNSEKEGDTWDVLDYIERSNNENSI